MKGVWQRFSAPVSGSFLRFEPYFFYGLLLLNLIPVFAVDVFYTGDGPAHLYNANIITQFILNESSPVGEFFELRNELIPNLGGHLLLTLFNILFPAVFAEKLVFALALLSLPLGFRYLVSQDQPSNSWLSYWSFLLAHNFCLYIGFQSFCLGLGAMFFGVAFFIRASMKNNASSWIIFGSVFFVTAIFHLFAAVVAGMLIASYYLFDTIQRRHLNLKILAAAIAVSIPTIALCGNYILSHSQGITIAPESFSQMAQGILHGVPLTTHDSAERPISYTFNIILLAGMILVSVHRFPNGFKFHRNDYALITSLLLFVLYFILPDKMATGGFVSMRLLLCAYITLALWCSLQIPPNRLALILMTALIALNATVIYYHGKHGQNLSDDAMLVMEAAEHIPAGSTVVPLNYTPHWLQYNIGLYLGVERDLVVLENYEASTNHFPVKWREGEFPGDLLGNFTTSKRPLFQIEPYEKQTGRRVDAVVRWDYQDHFNDSSTIKTNALLNRHFSLTYSSDSEKIQVFLRKPRE